MTKLIKNNGIAKKISYLFGRIDIFIYFCAKIILVSNKYKKVLPIDKNLLNKLIKYE